MKSFISHLVLLCLEGFLLRASGQYDCGTTPALNSIKTARIFGGKGVKYGEAPWQVNLFENGRRKCGATLVHHKWVISASHCIITKAINPNIVKVYTVVAGDHDITKEDAFEQLRYVIRIMVHPEYVVATFENDIVLLEVDHEFEYTRYVLPACLPWFDEIPFPYTTCTVTGWGFVSNVKKADVLQTLDIPVVLQKACEIIHHEGTGVVNFKRGMMCAGYLEGKRDSCKGDSGGPLVCPRYGKENNPEKVLTGVVSWGKGCAEKGQAGVYVSVTNYMEWINQTLALPPVYNDDPCQLGGVRISDVMEGSISSPGYREKGGGQYPPSSHCAWEFDLSSVASSTSSILLRFNALDIERRQDRSCDYDYVKIFTGDDLKQLLGTYCGNVIPDDITISRSQTLKSTLKFKIVFHSDRTIGNNGFQLGYELARLIP